MVKQNNKKKSSFWRDIFTGKNNKTYEISRVLLFEGVQAYIIFSIYYVWHTGGDKFDPVAFGVGLASLLGGGAVGVAVKAKDEPNPTDDEDDDDDEVSDKKRDSEKLPDYHAPEGDEADK